MDGMNTLPARDETAKGSAVARRRVFLFINGIHVLPGDAEGWTDRAVTWTHIKTDARGEKFEYATTAVTRVLRQQQRAKKFARMIEFYLGSSDQWQVNLVGHSNGCDIILRALRIIGARWEWLNRVAINSVHLIAAACEADFEKNRLSNLLTAGVVGRVVVYVGRKDRAMQLARLSKFSPFPFLRYGDLGRTGPIMPQWMWETNQAFQVVTHVKDEFDHSTWFERGERFSATMRMVTGDSELWTPHPPLSGSSSKNKDRLARLSTHGGDLPAGDLSRRAGPTKEVDA